MSGLPAVPTLLVLEALPVVRLLILDATEDLSLFDTVVVGVFFLLDAPFLLTAGKGLKLVAVDGLAMLLLTMMER